MERGPGSRYRRFKLLAFVLDGVVPSLLRLPVGLDWTRVGRRLAQQDTHSVVMLLRRIGGRINWNGENGEEEELTEVEKMA